MGTDFARRKDPPSWPTSYLHMQDWEGQFDERGVAAGFTSPYSIRGVAVADYNRDGWSEVAQWTRPEGNSPGIQFYQNNSAAQNGDFHFLTLELEGDPTLPGSFKSTRDAIGARAYVSADFDGNGTVDADETRLEEVLSGHSNASTTSSLALEFGLGQAETADVRIVWGSGREMQLRGVAADQFLAVREQAANVDVLLGDYNDDGIVDAGDYTMYRDTYGSLVTPFAGADGSGDGIVDAADHAVWSANFGLSLPASASLLSTIEHAEPQSTTAADDSTTLGLPLEAFAQLGDGFRLDVSHSSTRTEQNAGTFATADTHQTQLLLALRSTTTRSGADDTSRAAHQAAFDELDASDAVDLALSADLFEFVDS